MDEYLNNRQNEILWNLLANPVNNGHIYTSDLQGLVTDFPQSGILRALLSHADGGQNKSHAAAYLNPKALYVIVNAPENLAILEDSQIVQQLSETTYDAGVEEEKHWQQEDEPQLNHFTDEVEAEKHFNTAPETVFDEIEYAPLIAEEVSEHDIVEDESEAVNNEHLSLAETMETSGHEHETDELPVEENKEHAIVSEHVTESELVNEAAPVEHEEDHIAEVEEELPVAEPEVMDIPAEEETERGVSAENIREDEQVTETPVFELAEPPRGIDDDVYDEIVGIEDISFAKIDSPAADETVPQDEAPVIDEEVAPIATNHAPVPEPVVQKERALNMDDEAEKLIVGNIAATDYFVFDRALNERKQVEPTENGSFTSSSSNVTELADTEPKPAAEKQDVSKYDDDTLPYTFLWWLNKTRKEHAGIYQPFKLDVSQAIRRAGADELQQQYYENIFHLSSVEELDRSTSQQPIEFDLKRKEDQLIKRFIIEEPHISAPSGDKLDTENKARKSAEDLDEFVTETLARIYTDQMLYHKAIITYKKLMLKFPEKSRYFADQIEQLENKTN